MVTVLSRSTVRVLAGLRKAWIAAAKAAGLPGLIPHDLCRSCVRNLQRAKLAAYLDQAKSWAR